MNKRVVLAASAAVLFVSGVALAQYPILDRIAEKAFNKYQSSSCEQLWQAKGERHTPEEQ